MQSYDEHLKKNQKFDERTKIVDERISSLSFKFRTFTLSIDNQHLR